MDKETSFSIVPNPSGYGFSVLVPEHAIVSVRWYLFHGPKEDLARFGVDPYQDRKCGKRWRYDLPPQASRKAAEDFAVTLAISA
jgi:hypothetical protein